MSRPDPNFLSAALAWHSKNVDALSDVGVESRVLGPTTGRSKNSATIEFVSFSLLVGVTMWDSGECEVIELATDGQHEPVVRVLTLDDVAAVRSLLDHLEFGP